MSDLVRRLREWHDGDTDRFLVELSCNAADRIEALQQQLSTEKHTVLELAEQLTKAEQQVRALERAASAREELVQKSRMGDRQHRTTT
jgi:uncharacterized protein involved in exopolysaccharide biosynthesis